MSKNTELTLGQSLFIIFAFICSLITRPLALTYCANTALSHFTDFRLSLLVSFQIMIAVTIFTANYEYKAEEKTAYQRVASTFLVAFLHPLMMVFIVKTSEVFFN